MGILRRRRARLVAMAVLASQLAGGPALARVATRPPHPAPARVLLEKDVNLDEADQVATLLGAAGVEVVRTRVDDTFVALGDRTATANGAAADLLVSVHNNASSNRALHGTEVYSQVGREASIALGTAVLDNVTRRTATSFRGVFQRPGRDADYYFVLRNSAMPAVIVEGAYVSNPAECARVATAELRRLTAEGIAAGVLETLGPLPAGAGPPAPAPVAGPLGDHLDAPANLVVRADRTAATLAWDSVAKATGYAVWRDGELVTAFRTSPSEVPVQELAGANTGPQHIVIEQPGPGIGVHHYEVRAQLDIAGRVVEESPSSAATVTLPWRVTIDAGHGGRDSGAVGRY